MQHCGVASVIAHKLAELRQAGIAAGDKMLNWMALNFGEMIVSLRQATHICIKQFCTCTLHSRSTAQ